MICRQCLQRASALQIPNRAVRTITSSSLTDFAPATAGSLASVEPTLSTPLISSSSQSPVSKTKTSNLPLSSFPAGTPLKGLNFLKGREDPLALPEEDYPEWLWKILDSGKKGPEERNEELGDEFCASSLSVLIFIKSLEDFKNETKAITYTRISKIQKAATHGCETAAEA